MPVSVEAVEDETWFGPVPPTIDINLVALDLVISG
jgi:hypothetical protein